MKKKIILENELKRFNSINKYVKNLLKEQETPEQGNTETAGLGGGVDTTGLGGGADTAGGLGGDEAGLGGGADTAGGLGGDEAGLGGGADTAGGLGGNETAGTEGMLGDETEELDITDLVNMTKSIKKDVESTKGEHDKVINKMDDVFKKLDDLSDKLKKMDNIFDRIDNLSSEIKQMKPETPQEKLEMRSLDSYPFNQKPNEFFSQKQQEMKMSGKNEYVLTKDDIENYSKEQLRNTFNPDIEDNDEYEQFR